MPAGADRSHVFIPETFMMVETVKSRIYESLFTNRPYVTILPRGNDDAVKSSSAESLLDWQFNERMRIPRLFADDVLPDAIIFGTTVVYTGWLKMDRKMRHRVTEEQVLTDDNGQPIPVIFRPWHENNGVWFWWGNTHCTPEEYRALYFLTQDYISNVQCPMSNIQWSYSPNLDGAMTEEKFLQWYPGDERIDLIGLDAYQWGTEEDFVRQTRADLDFLCAFGKQHHKPVALTECGFINVPDPTWWDRVLLPILADYPLTYALVWRNAEKEHFGPVPNTEAAEHFRNFYNSKHTLFLQDIAK